MDGVLFDGDGDANTPLEPHERDGLIPSYITQRRELNEAEQVNIGKGDRWAFNPRTRRDALTEAFPRESHKPMFDEVWRWAGQFRTTPRNIGVEVWKIAPDIKVMLDDVRYWSEHQTFPADEIAVRFHHRPVAIQPFPNGNGRCAHLAADVVAVRLGQDRFSGGGADLVAIAEIRRGYVAAVKSAAAGANEPLLAFCRA